MIFFSFTIKQTDIKDLLKIAYLHRDLINHEQCYVLMRDTGKMYFTFLACFRLTQYRPCGLFLEKKILGVTNQSAYRIVQGLLELLWTVYSEGITIMLKIKKFSKG